MNKYDFDKKIVKLNVILSDLRGIREDMDILSSRLYDAIYELEHMKSDLETFSDELDEENKDAQDWWNKINRNN